MKETNAPRALSVITLALVLAVSYGAACDTGAGPDDDSLLDRIDISPSPLVERPLGGTVQFTATAFDGTGKAMVPQPSFEWVSGNRVARIEKTGPSSALATVQNCGAGATDCGTCSRITATSGSVVGETFVAIAGRAPQYADCPPR